MSHVPSMPPKATARTFFLPASPSRGPSALCAPLAVQVYVPQANHLMLPVYREFRIFPRGRSAAQRRALKRRYVAIEVTGPLQVGGGPFDVRLKIARKEAGRNGPQGPGVN